MRRQMEPDASLLLYATSASREFVGMTVTTSSRAANKTVTQPHNSEAAPHLRRLAQLATKRPAWLALQIMLTVAGCASAATRSATVPPTADAPRPVFGATSPASSGATTASGRAASGALPPVPAVNGAPLNPRVQYPSENQVIASRDSNFILGSVGSGDATLAINGFPVAVAANGAFIGWLPNPPAASAQYNLIVARGADTVRRVLRVRFPVRVILPGSGRLKVDTASVLPVGRPRMRGDEPVRVGVRAPLNAKAWLQIVTVTAGDSRADTVRLPMVPASLTQANIDRASHGTNALLTTAILPAGEDVGGTFVTDVPAARLALVTRDSLRINARDAARDTPRITSRIYVVRGADTVHLAISPPQLVDPMVRVTGILRPEAAFESDTDRVVIGRPVPEGTYKWLLIPGTVVEMTGRQGAFTRVRLDDNLEVWVSSADIAQLPDGTPLPRRLTGGMRVVPAAGWADVVIPMAERPPFIVEPNGHTLVVTLYGTSMSPEISPILGNDTLVRQISWDQVTTDRVRVELRLSQPVYGWLTQWDEARRALVIRVRRLPRVDTKNPLGGLVIAVDPGHPPAGATGPTGLFEGDAVLPVGELVAGMLREKGAIVVMTRTSKAPVGLTERTVTARRANANAFVSIHLNAFGDGVNPFTSNGTSTLFFHQSSEPLARPVQRELMKRLGLRDLGVHYQNLAVARPTWYPAVLTEGAFVIIPEQESALRDVGYQRRYAEGIVAGLESYFRDLAQQ